MEEAFELLENLVFVFLFVAIILNAYTVRKFGKGLLNIVFVSFGFCAFFFLSSFVFMMLAHEEMLVLSEVTQVIWMHVLIYLAFAALIWGGHRIKRATDMGDTTGLGYKDGIAYGIMFAIMALIFMFVGQIEDTVVSNASQFLEAIELLGLHHFMVFFLGGIAAWYLRYIKGNWGLLSESMSFIIWFIVLIALQHFWENLTESWQVIQPEEVIIEGVELLLVLPALVFYCIGQWKIIKFIKG